MQVLTMRVMAHLCKCLITLYVSVSANITTALAQHSLTAWLPSRQAQPIGLCRMNNAPCMTQWCFRA